MSDFDKLIEEFSSKKQGMKDVGLGEAIGKDPIARKNCTSLAQQLKILQEKVEQLMEENKGLNNKVTELSTKLVNMETVNNELRAKLYQLGY